MRAALVVIALVFGAGAGFCVGWQLGQYYAVRRKFERRFEADCELVAPVLAADPAFRRLETFNFPVAGLCLGGPVATREDIDRLRAAACLFGAKRAGHVVQDVWVERAAESRGCR